MGFSNISEAEKFAKAASQAKRQGSSTCIVDGNSYSVLDIKNALLRECYGELVRKYDL